MYLHHNENIIQCLKLPIWVCVFSSENLEHQIRVN